MIQTDLNNRLQNLESGLQKTQARLKQFETQYQWIQNYIREDTPSQSEKRAAQKYCKLSHALTQKDIWNFEHEVLNELKEFLY
jgi:hypothetical protein